MTPRRYHRLTLYAEDGTAAILEPDTTLAYEEERERFERFDGTLDELLLSRTLSAESADLAFLSQVEAWRKLGTQVRAFVEGDAAHIIWREPVVPTVATVRADAPGIFARQVSLYSADPTAVIGEAVNLLAPLGWLGLDGLPDVYELTAPAYSSASLAPTGLATFTGEENATTGLRATCRAPRPGRTATASVLVESHDADSGQGGPDDLRLRALCLDAAGAVLASGSAAIGAGFSGEISASVAVPAGCVLVAWEIELTVGSQPPGGVRSIEFRVPTLRLDGRSVSYA
jgi:hypothetical protein